MSQWTETIEKNLIAMQQNAKKLAENYLERYNSFKNITTYMNVPLLLLSALNAYVIYEAGSYSRGVQIGSSATSLGIAIILSGEFLYMFRNKIENTFLKFKKFENLEQSIQQILSVDRLHRTLEADNYFEETFRQYKTLVDNDMFIMKYLGNLGVPEEMTKEDIPAILNDHWNILFRPTFRRIKRKNQKVIEALKSTGQRYDVENVSSTDLLNSDPLELEKEDEVKTLSSWLYGIWKKKDERQTPVFPSLLGSNPPIAIVKSSDTDVESWGSAFWNTKKDPEEVKKPSVMVEMSNVYPEIIQKVMYEPMKRPALAMSFSEKK